MSFSIFFHDIFVTVTTTVLRSRRSGTRLTAFAFAICKREKRPRPRTTLEPPSNKFTKFEKLKQANLLFCGCLSTMRAFSLCFFSTQFMFFVVVAFLSSSAVVTSLSSSTGIGITSSSTEEFVLQDSAPRVLEPPNGVDDHHIWHELAQDDDDEATLLFGRELKPLRTTNVKVSSAVRTGGTTGTTANKPQRVTKPKLPKTYGGKALPNVLPQTPTLGPTEKPPTSVLFDALSVNDKYLTCLQYYSDAGAPQQGGKGGGSTKGGNDSKGTTTGEGLSGGKGGKAGGSTKASPDLVIGVTKVNPVSYQKIICVRILNN